MSARDDILSSLRARSRPPSARPTTGELRAAIPARATAAGVDIVGLFAERASRRGAIVKEIATRDDLVAEVARIGETLSASSAAICSALFDLPWSDAGLEARPHPPRAEERVAVSVATCAIAETGTLMLSSAKNAHSATVLPHTHVVCVAKSDVVATLEDAFARVGSSLPRAIVLVTGVSSTGDIGLQVVAPAQGPTALYIALVNDGLDLGALS